MWQEKNGSLYRKFSFKDFDQAFEFMQSVAKLAEQHNHHPKWTNEWNTVEIWLSTHSAGKVTDKDHQLAGAIDSLLGEDKLAGAAMPQIYNQVKLYTDGGSRGNPGPSASGFVVMDPAENILARDGVYLGITTNNQAEYHSLRLGLECAKKLGARQVNVYMDSMLVVNQMKGTFKVKNRDLWPIHEKIKQLATHFKTVTYTHVPRELNKLADAEVNKALDHAKSSHQSV